LDADLRSGFELMVTRFLVTVLAAVMVTACSETTSPSRSSTHHASQTPSTSSTPRATLAGCPPAVSEGSLPVLAHISGDPDDITAAPSGHLWLSDRNGERILELDTSGKVLHTYFDRNGPEGIVVLDDGKLIVAQQVPNRLDLFDPKTATFTPWLQLGATSLPTDGVDGITREGPAVLVPDSARGQLFSVGIDPRNAAQTPVLIAGGLGRPVAALQLPDASYLVAVENDPGLWRVPTSITTATPVSGLHSLDDLLFVNGVVYATDLADHSLIAIDVAAGKARTLVSGAMSPQGVALLSTGNLVLVDSSDGLVALLPPCR
jgi:DNA-binding beta-propeller fold protein YncE